MSLALIYRIEVFFLFCPFNIQRIESALQGCLFPALVCYTVVQTFMKPDVSWRLYDTRSKPVLC
jgi:hypothetical protein